MNKYRSPIRDRIISFIFAFIIFLNSFFFCSQPVSALEYKNESINIKSNTFIQESVIKNQPIIEDKQIDIYTEEKDVEIFDSKKDEKIDIHDEEEKIEIFDSKKNVNNQTVDVSIFVWDYLKNKNYSDAVCAGIIGNLMSEVGGHTLKLDYKSVDGEASGICQWTSGRRKKLKEKYGSDTPDLEKQLDYMYDELLGLNGIRRQINHEEYSKLINSSTPEEAALYFAKYYERCSKKGYEKRKKNAIKAYNYFKGE